MEQPLKRSNPQIPAINHLLVVMPTHLKHLESQTGCRCITMKHMRCNHCIMMKATHRLSKHLHTPQLFHVQILYYLLSYITSQERTKRTTNPTCLLRRKKTLMLLLPSWMFRCPGIGSCYTNRNKIPNLRILGQ